MRISKSDLVRIGGVYCSVTDDGGGHLTVVPISQYGRLNTRSGQPVDIVVFTSAYKDQTPGVDISEEALLKWVEEMRVKIRGWIDEAKYNPKGLTVSQLMYFGTELGIIPFEKPWE